MQSNVGFKKRNTICTQQRHCTCSFTTLTFCAPESKDPPSPDRSDRNPYTACKTINPRMTRKKMLPPPRPIPYAGAAYKPPPKNGDGAAYGTAYENPGLGAMYWRADGPEYDRLGAE
jgi:hypothetical protein